MAKKYDVVAVVGKYIDQTGQEKLRYETVGAVIQNQSGGFNLLLKKTFNPAGLADPDKESIILSLFEPRPQNGQQAAGQQAPRPTPNPSPMAANPRNYTQQAASTETFPDDIPF